MAEREGYVDDQVVLEWEVLEVMAALYPLNPLRVFLELGRPNVQDRLLIYKLNWDAMTRPVLPGLSTIMKM